MKCFKDFVVTVILTSHIDRRSEKLNLSHFTIVCDVGRGNKELPWTGRREHQFSKLAKTILSSAKFDWEFRNTFALRNRVVGK